MARAITAILLAIVTLTMLPACGAASRTATHGAVATVHPLATQAGLDALAAGGNAVDAAVAAALTLGVVDGFNSGIGGGCFMLLRLSDGSMHALDGREMAPAAASRDMYIINGRLDPDASQTGALAIGVPGSLAVYDHAVRRHGRLTLAQLIRPAATIAEQGFTLDDDYAARLRSAADGLRRFEASRAIFLHADGSPLDSGQTLRQPDLAAAYRAIADHGVDWFYTGPFAEAVERWMKANGGIVTAADFSRYRLRMRQPLVTTYRGHTIVGFPPPSSGGVHVAQILGMVERFDLAAMHRRDPALVPHVLAEAMKLAFADRAHWLGDPDYANVPRGLIDPQYLHTLSQRIRLDKAIDVPAHGNPPDAETKLFSRHTTHVAAADEHGNVVALTATVNTTFGSKVVVPGTGVVLNNQMDDFSIQPGVPNAFGLVGAEANAVGPSKRPLSSMSPTIVLRDGRPVLTAGAAGGPRIITQVVQVIVNRIDLDMPLPEAVAAPRVHHQWNPGQLHHEPSLDEATIARLKALGHDTRSSGGAGVTQAIDIDLKARRFTPVHDPRVPGSAGVSGETTNVE